MDKELVTTTTILFAILVALGIGTVIYAVVALARNQRVYTYRAEVIEWIYDEPRKTFEKSEQTTKDFKRYTNEVSRRQRIFESVDYDTMVHKFWKPLDSFYPEYAKYKKGEK